MDKKTAIKIIEKYNQKDNYTEDDDFMFIEACQYLIDTSNDTDAMVNLGGYY